MKMLCLTCDVSFLGSRSSGNSQSWQLELERERGQRTRRNLARDRDQNVFLDAFRTLNKWRYKYSNFSFHSTSRPDWGLGGLGDALICLVIRFCQLALKPSRAFINKRS